MKYANYPHVVQIFKQIPEFYHDAFLGLIQQVSNHVIKYEKCMVLQVYNPISDGHCGFRSLAVALFKNEKGWQDIKAAMKDQLVKQEELYCDILGYNMINL
ncbi:10332_t:CDS:2 [Dentiscutata heterogama]|uniref:10332_t:CDS:1 n=1 Tax=Dentiscutata heterogama TaxID=1316150 RepID=A0ACA9K6D3_9GLOM|nr:10332_t:CDS:2 [Dentiscutata heterogama]